MLYLNRANRIIGSYQLSKGGITGTIADVRLILSVALKTLATGLILAHNHPSGNLKPSEAVAIMKKGLGVKESTDDDDFDSDTTGAEGLQSTNPLSPINEARYTEFKKMTQVRTPGEQLHRAIREIRRKIDEINKLVSYTEKMKTEMKSDANEVNYLKRTKEALSKISAKIQETNNKIKRLVQ